MKNLAVTSVLALGFAGIASVACNRTPQVSTPRGNDTTQQAGQVDALNNPESRNQTGLNESDQNYSDQNHADQPGTVGSQTGSGDAQHPGTLNSNQSKSSSQTSDPSSITNSNR